LEGHQPTAALKLAVHKLGFTESQTHWTRLAGGHSNISWKMATAENNFVVKLYPQLWDNPLFANSVELEAGAMIAFGPLRLAPQMIGRGQADKLDFIVYKHIVNDNTTLSPLKVGALLRRVHRQGATVLEFKRNLRLGQQPNRIIEQLTVGLSSVTKDLLLEVANSFSPIKNPVLLHGDATPANFVTSSTGLMLLDWQCPILGDPCFDLALFLSPSMRLAYGYDVVTQQDEDQILQGYGRADISTRYSGVRSAYHALFAAYSFWQVENGNHQYSAGFEAEMKALQNIRDS
jgi:thiamine kinase